MIKLLIGGSPCTCLSVAQKGGREAVDTIKNLPTADVVEVVRCGECEYLDRCNQSIRILGNVEMLESCSYGKRREKGGMMHGD